jgi:hypothetical protein
MSPLKEHDTWTPMHRLIFFFLCALKCKKKMSLLNSVSDFHRLHYNCAYSSTGDISPGSSVSFSFLLPTI